MRIAHLTPTFPPDYAGTGNVCYHNARLLAPRGHEVRAYTAKLNGEMDQSAYGFGIKQSMIFGIPGTSTLATCPTPSIMAAVSC